MTNFANLTTRFDPPPPEPIFFGIWSDRPGHGFHVKGGRSAGLPHGWISRIDSLLPPQVAGQPMHKGTLTYMHGWSIIAVWDRTVDKRPGSNAAFILPGRLTWKDACAIAQRAFPDQWVRVGPIEPFDHLEALDSGV